MDPEEIKRCVSFMIADALSAGGVSHARTQVLRSESLIMELTNLYLYKTVTIYGGSSVDGSFSKGSDVDELSVMNGMTVVHTKEEAGDSNAVGHMFLADSKHVQPGFAKLKLFRLCDQIMNNNLEKVLVKQNDASYLLSSELFVPLLSNYIRGRDKPWVIGYANAQYYVHGPCATAHFSKGMAAQKLEPETDFDRASGITCVSWPEEAMEWIDRQSSNNGWPTYELANKIKSMVCHVLPVGDPSSSTCPVEWRYAFSYHERELTWSFNDTQLQCYVILKNIRKEYIHQIAQEELATYHMKTLMFWVSECQNVDFWRNDNLMNCVESCLRQLYEYIQEGYLPHYFIVKRNLLYKKFQNYETKEKTLHTVRKILEDITTYVIQIPAFQEIERVRNIWRNSDEHLAKVASIYKILKPNSQLQSDTYCRQLSVYTSSFKVCITLGRFPSELQDMQRLMTILNKPPADIDKELAERCVNLAAAVIAWKFFTAFTEATKTEEKMILMAACKCVFNMAWNADALAGKLQVATFHFLHKEYVQVLSILDSAVSATSVLLYPAWCSKLRYISVTNGTVQQSAEGPSSFNNVGVAFDVMFTKENIQHVPYAIQFECALLGETNINFALFHPIVYAFYLLFEVYFKFGDTRKRDEYILHLSNVVHSTEGGLERHHALNILGVCFQKMGNLHEAFSQFSQSLKECQNKTNAAVYHLVILAFHCLRDRRFDLSLEGFNCHQNNNWEVSKRHVVIYRRDPGFQ